MVWIPYRTVDAVINGLDADDLWKMSDNLPKVKWFKNTCILPSEILLHMIPNIVYGLAVTQEDALSGMLALGAGYFVFRPAYLVSILKDISHVEDKLYFPHACVPGLAYDVFLEQAVTFPETHSAGIVTVHIRWDGVAGECQQPAFQGLDAAMSEVIPRCNGQLRCGPSSCLNELSISFATAANV